ncbi:MAG TPA: DUF4153 domain-containing protein [Caulobacteraceae bacterium]|nr:DUF4153 domain-containing protein [Caulobacteraceae bacterium]
MADAVDVAGRAEARLGVARLAVGVAQGVVFLGLHHAQEGKTWPATDGPAFAAIAMAAFFTPLVIIVGLGHMRRATLLAWTLGVAGLAAGLGAYAVANSVRQYENSDPALVPDFPVWAAMAAFVFIGHRLIAPADARRRWLAPYPDYFDVGWLGAAQLALALVFTMVFWFLLKLGAALFNLIGLHGFETAITTDWFYFPATTFAFAAGLHLADVRVGLTRGVRTIGLFLLSWLLPLMSLIAVGFLAALPITGLAPLWASKMATAVLLWSLAALIILANATYRDGEGERVAPAFRWIVRVTAIALVPLAVVAAVGLWLRVHQHGLTPERIVAGACVLVALVYAVGYAAAAVLPGRWMRRLETTNVAAAFLILGLIVALFSPIADPRPIAVADQVSRLTRGVVAPGDFDFVFLRYRAGRAGLAALETLATQRGGPNAVVIAQDAARALESKNAYEAALTGTARFEPFPRGASLPEGLLAALQRDPTYYACRQAPCEVYRIALAGAGNAQYLVSMGFVVRVYSQAGGVWSMVGQVNGPICPAARQALRAGQAVSAPTAPSWKDVVAGGQRLVVIPLLEFHGCPTTASGAPGPSPMSPDPSPR